MQTAHLFPFGHCPHLVVAPLSQPSRAGIVLLLMPGSGQEPLGRLRLVDRLVAPAARPAGLRLECWAVRGTALWRLLMPRLH